ncbi:hypothetical protein [Halorussus salinus]|uniref:hypothetical protein n=1 Tax=Halorussus salinus TaxID=1364935 RepID=UPI0010920F9E|nr:hypothetical protein [Halorussus salinus]
MTLLTIFTGWSTNTLLGAFISLLVVQIATTHEFLKRRLNDIDKSLEKVRKSTKNESIVDPIREPNFYSHFLQKVRSAKHQVFISYFDNKSPLDSANENKINYYREIERVTKSSDAQFRRLIRAIPEMEEWVEELVETHKGDGNFSLACLPDNKPEKDLNEHIAVQLIDDESAYFVAVGEQRESTYPRDSYIRSEELNDQWGQYYKRLWEQSYVVIDRGRIVESEYKKYKEHINNLKKRD